MEDNTMMDAMMTEATATLYGMEHEKIVKDNFDGLYDLFVSSLKDDAFRKQVESLKPRGMVSKWHHYLYKFKAERMRPFSPLLSYIQLNSRKKAELPAYDPVGSSLTQALTKRQERFLRGYVSGAREFPCNISNHFQRSSRLPHKRQLMESFSELCPLKWFRELIYIRPL